jgi:hypothetical protein
MDKAWISKLAGDVEAKHGKEARDKIFGDIESVKTTPKSVSEWFDSFTTGMDELGDKEFLQQILAKRCPCGGNWEKQGKNIKALYDKSKTLEEFIELLRPKHGDILELKGNILYLTKPLSKSRAAGSCGKGCHCGLAKGTDKAVSDIFCKLHFYIFAERGLKRSARMTDSATVTENIRNRFICALRKPAMTAFAVASCGSAFR